MACVNGSRSSSTDDYDDSNSGEGDTEILLVIVAAVPREILQRDRFMARHMTSVRIDPEAATVAPQAISNLF